MSIRLGKDAVMYVGGSYDANGVLSNQCALLDGVNPQVWSTTPASWNEVCEVKDVTINAQLSLADVTDRCSAQGWRLQVGTLADGTIDTSMNYDTESNGYDYFQYAYFNRDIIVVAIMDRDAKALPAGVSAEGLVAPMQVTNFSINQALEDAITVDLQLTLTRLSCQGSPAFPQWVNYFDLTP